MTDRFFFLHLQKTAGTALWQRLNEAFAPEELYPGPGDGAPPLSTLSVPHLLERWEVRAAQVRLVAGHFPLCTTELLGGGFATFTVLRDPVERVLSGLRHYREQEPGMAHVALEEIYDDPLRRRLLRNHMVKMLSLTVDEMDDGALTDVAFTPARLDAAVAALRGIDVVGLQTRFDDFCAALSLRWGWDLGRPRFANRSTPGEVSAAFRARIEHDNADDRALYEVATDLAV